MAFVVLVVKRIQFRIPVWFLYLGFLYAGPPIIYKVEPPNWWAGTGQRELVVLLTGENMDGAKVQVLPPGGVTVQAEGATQGGRYLFARMKLSGNLKPGKYVLQVTNPDGNGRWDFPVEPRVDPGGDFRDLARTMSFTS